MKRRANIAAGLLHEPQLLFLDEPTVGVDPQSRNFIFEGVEALKKAGLTVIYTTHYMEEAQRLCDRASDFLIAPHVADNSEMIRTQLRRHRSHALRIARNDDDLCAFSGVG